MSAFDIGGRIVIDGEFDETFDRLEMRAEEAERALNDIDLKPMEGADEGVKEAIAAQLAEVEKLEQALGDLRAEVDTDEADKELADLQAKVQELHDKLAGGEELTPVEKDFLAGAQSAVEALKGKLSGAAAGAVETALSLGKVAKAALGVAAGVAAAVGAVASFIREQGMLGTQLNQTEAAFEALANSRGVNADALLSGLEEASRGAVTASALMEQANKTILDGAEDIATKLPQLYDAARASAILTGRETNAAFQGIVGSVLALDEAGLRAQGAFVSLAAANQEWADANGRMVESLSQAEKQMIAATAAAEAMVPIARDMGIETATAAEKLALLPQVLKDVKEGFAQTVAAGTLFQGFLTFMQDLGQNLQVGVQVRESYDEINRLESELRALGANDAADKLVAQIQAVNEEFARMPARTLEEATTVSADKAEEIDRLAASARQLAEALAAVDSPSGLVPLAENAGRAADATTTFAAALVKAREGLAGLDTLERQFASAIAQAEDAMRNVPEMPDITAFMDADKLRAWGDAWAALNPNLAEANEQLQSTAASIDQFQAKVLAQAAGIGSMGERLEFLAQAFLGADATGDDFAAMLDGLPPKLLAAIGPLDEIAAAVVNLRAATDEPVTIDVMIRNQERVKSTIDSLAARVGSIYGIEEARQFHEMAVDEWEDYWGAVDKTGELGEAVALDKFVAWLTGMVDAADPALHQIQRSFQKTFEIIGMSVSELRGKIESALLEGSTVTASDFTKTLAGTYEDAPLEAARRLDAIAARGFAELQAHPDWAAILAIPEGILTGSEQQLKDWAAGTAESVRNLEDWTRIDWNAFAREFEEQLNREAAREVTLDVAVTELDKRGLLSGSPEERRKRVAEAMGLTEDLPVTFDALFKAEKAAAQSSIREQVGPVPLDVFFQRVSEGLTPEEKADLGITPAPEVAEPELGLMPRFIRPLEEIVADWVSTETEMPSVDVSKFFDPEASKDALAASGAEAVAYVEEGAVLALTTAGTTTIAMTVASRWSADFTANQPLFETIGKSAGGVVGAAFLTAMEENAGKVRRRIAELVAPEVAAILNAGSGGSMP